MAGASLLTLIDDIATLLDDVSLMTKVAVKKTAGVLGDDLALNAQQVSGVKADRELPVVWAVAKGSLRNKAILVPAALLISAIAPWAVTPLLMLGGAFLCYEGAEKLFHAFTHSKADAEQAHGRLVKTLSDPNADVVALERGKIKGAVRTDFILSAEIIAITLGSVAGAPFMQQIAVLVGIGLIMTVGVYGLVAGIVKLDDLGLLLSRQRAAPARAAGNAIVRVAPYLMKSLSVIGTAAMFMVGGGILAHGLPVAHHGVEALAHVAADLPSVGTILGPLSETVLNAALGALAGAVILAVVAGVGALRRRAAS
ncbi:DUF808 domain-containing protein [Billgrantia pellis]|uniref:DUF808 domain-containing protein n=1 Tax=Billgrantia pellis TaxID=2606936 RepID=A0A7V7G0M3_9GAMM|nr:DUF808 domain-containing protein [Halomonas pellis]KAA0013017.1 DUF808 domain-containing protein [Halomonas pellis]